MKKPGRSILSIIVSVSILVLAIFSIVTWYLYFVSSRQVLAHMSPENEILPISLTVYGRGSDTISARLAFYSADWTILNTLERSWPGWEISLDSFTIRSGAGLQFTTAPESQHVNGKPWNGSSRWPGADSRKWLHPDGSDAKQPHYGNLNPESNISCMWMIPEICLSASRKTFPSSSRECLLLHPFPPAGSVHGILPEAAEFPVKTGMGCIQGPRPSFFAGGSWK